jgi:leucyl/phenylalanyl-tRNA--protein transferase
VLEACAAERAYAEDTWINRPIQSLYGELFARGLAHSVECWAEGVLVGGLYGVSLGGAFFGESMFSTARDAARRRWFTSSRGYGSADTACSTASS